MRSSTTTTTTTTTTKPPKGAAKKSAARRGGGAKPKASMKSNSAAVAGRPQQGLKVVHISNPMKVEVSPAEFRSLVQELTGRHAIEWPDHPRWRKSALSGFALDNIANDQQIRAPAGAHEEVDTEDAIHQDMDAVGVGHPGISCYFGSDLCYDDFHRPMMVSLEDDLISSFIYNE